MAGPAPNGYQKPYKSIFIHIHNVSGPGFIDIPMRWHFTFALCVLVYAYDFSLIFICCRLFFFFFVLVVSCRFVICCCSRRYLMFWLLRRYCHQIDIQYKRQKQKSQN